MNDDKAGWTAEHKAKRLVYLGLNLADTRRQNVGNGTPGHKENEAFDVPVVSLSECRRCGGGSGLPQVLAGWERMIGREGNKSIREEVDRTNKE